MFKKIGIILFFLASVGARHAVPLRGLAFADVPLSQQADPCPPECVSDSMEIVTWYPSPYSEYEELRLYPTQRDDNYCDDNKIGLMYYDDGGTPSFGDNDKIRVCKGTLLGWQEVGGESFWKFAANSTSDIYYTKSGNVGIGTDNPKTALDVGGVLTFRSQSNPIVSNAGEGRLYFDSANNKFKISENGAAYKDLGAQAAGLQQISGSNPSCPSGQYALLRKWNSKTCGNSIQQCVGSSSAYPCTTGSGWLGEAPTCNYVWISGVCPGDYLTCSADSWSNVICIGS